MLGFTTTMMCTWEAEFLYEIPFRVVIKMRFHRENANIFL